MTVRLKDLAAETGYSINTVSLALKDSELVRRETKEKILKAAEEMNYVPNNVARALVKNKTNTVGLILTDIKNPILTSVAQHIEAHLREHNYNIILMNTYRDAGKELNALEVLRGRRVDGILLYPVGNKNKVEIAQIRKNNYPIVLLDGDLSIDCDTVTLDEAHGSYKAVSYLINNGHKKIAFINGSKLASDLEKLKGYKKALKEANISFNPRLVVTPEDIGYKYGYNVTAELLSQSDRPTAIFASTDSLALGCMKWCQEHGKEIPDDVSIVGFDDIEASRYTGIPLTTVSYKVEEIASKATERLLGLIDAKMSSSMPLQKCQKKTIKPTLVVRDSTKALR